MTGSRQGDWHLLKRMVGEARPFWASIFGLFLLDLLGTPLALLVPIPLKIAVDNVIGSQPLPGFLSAILPDSMRSDASLLAFAVALVLAVALLNRLQGLASSFCSAYVSERMVLGFRSRLFGHVQRLSLAYHDSKGTTDSMYRIQYDASSIQRIAMESIIPFVTALVTVLAMVAVIATIDWVLAIVALAVTVPLVLTIRGFRKPLRRRWRKVYDLESEAWKVIHEVLAAVRVVKVFGQEKREQGRFVDQYSEGVDARLNVELVQGGYALAVGLITAAGTASVLFIGVGHVVSGSLSLGALLVVMSYLSQLFDPLKTIGRQVTSLQGYLASAERVFSVLDETPEVIERQDARPLTAALGSIAFRRVTFSYDPEHPVLQDISFEVSAGMRVGVAGRTGAGKTTLINLLTRFYDPDTGEILLDGVDIRDYRLNDLRRQFAIVLQEPVLFSTSISENIAYGRPGASREEIVDAAMAADAHDFILSLPDGYGTPVGERGMRLSGGERQRIGLARAFLKNAPILILDEPTSSVDMDTETSIMKAMERLMHGRTTFIIAHRLTTLEGCDILLVLRDGRVVLTSNRPTVALQEALDGGGLDAVIGGGNGYL